MKSHGECDLTLPVLTRDGRIVPLTQTFQVAGTKGIILSMGKLWKEGVKFDVDEEMIMKLAGDEIMMTLVGASLHIPLADKSQVAALQAAYDDGAMLTQADGGAILAQGANIQGC